MGRTVIFLYVLNIRRFLLKKAKWSAEFIAYSVRSRQGKLIAYSVK